MLPLCGAPRLRGGAGPGAPSVAASSIPSGWAGAPSSGRAAVGYPGPGAVVKFVAWPHVGQGALALLAAPSCRPGAGTWLGISLIKALRITLFGHALSCCSALRPLLAAVLFGRAPSRCSWSIKSPDPTSDIYVMSSRKERRSRFLWR